MSAPLRQIGVDVLTVEVAKRFFANDPNSYAQKRGEFTCWLNQAENTYGDKDQLLTKGEWDKISSQERFIHSRRPILDFLDQQFSVDTIPATKVSPSLPQDPQEIYFYLDELLQAKAFYGQEITQARVDRLSHLREVSEIENFQDQVIQLVNQGYLDRGDILSVTDSIKVTESGNGKTQIVFDTPFKEKEPKEKKVILINLIQKGMVRYVTMQLQATNQPERLKDLIPSRYQIYLDNNFNPGAIFYSHATTDKKRMEVLKALVAAVFRGEAGEKSKEAFNNGNLLKGFYYQAQEYLLMGQVGQAKYAALKVKELAKNIPSMDLETQEIYAEACEMLRQISLQSLQELFEANESLARQRQSHLISRTMMNRNPLWFAPDRINQIRLDNHALLQAITNVIEAGYADTIDEAISYLQRNSQMDDMECVGLKKNDNQRLFGPHGYWEKLASTDYHLRLLLESESRLGSEQMQDPQERAAYLMVVAKELRSKTGSYEIAAKIYEDLFANNLDPFVERIRIQDQEKLRAKLEVKRESIKQSLLKEYDLLRKTNPDYYHTLFPGNRIGNEELEERVTQIIEQKVDGAIRQKALREFSKTIRKSKSSSISEVSKNAWFDYQDMVDPFSELLNFSDVGSDDIYDEILISAFTMPLTMGVGVGVRAGLAGTTFALRQVAMGGARSWLTKATIFSVGSAMEGCAMEAFNLVLGGEGDPRNIGRNILMSASFHGGGKLWHGLKKMTPYLTDDVMARAVGARAFKLKTADFMGMMGIQTGIATAIGHIEEEIQEVESNLSFAERIGGNFLRMSSFHFGTAGINLLSGNLALRAEQRSQLRMAMARDFYTKLQRRPGVTMEEARNNAIRAARELVPGASTNRLHAAGKMTYEDIIRLRELGIDLPVPRDIGSSERASKDYLLNVGRYRQLIERLKSFDKDSPLSEVIPVLRELDQVAVAVYSKAVGVYTQEGAMSQLGGENLADLAFKLRRGKVDHVYTATILMRMTQWNGKSPESASFLKNQVFKAAQDYFGEASIANHVLVSLQLTSVDKLQTFVRDLPKLVERQIRGLRGEEQQTTRALKEVERRIAQLEKRHGKTEDSQSMEYKALLAERRSLVGKLEVLRDDLSHVSFDRRGKIELVSPDGKKNNLDDFNFNLPAAYDEVNAQVVKQAHRISEIEKELMRARDRAIKQVESIANDDSWTKIHGPLDPVDLKTAHQLFREGKELTNLEIFRRLARIHSQTNGSSGGALRFNPSEDLPGIYEQLANKFPLTDISTGDSNIVDSVTGVRALSWKTGITSDIGRQSKINRFEDLSSNTRELIGELQKAFDGPMDDRLAHLYVELGGLSDLNLRRKLLVHFAGEAPTHGELRGFGWDPLIERTTRMIDRLDPTRSMSELNAFSDFNRLLQSHQWALQFAEAAAFDPRDRVTRPRDVLAQATAKSVLDHYLKMTLPPDDAGILCWGMEMAHFKDYGSNPNNAITPNHFKDTHALKIRKMTSEVQKYLLASKGIKVPIEAFVQGDEMFVTMASHDAQGHKINAKVVSDAYRHVLGEMFKDPTTGKAQEFDYTVKVNTAPRSTERLSLYRDAKTNIQYGKKRKANGKVVYYQVTDNEGKKLETAVRAINLDESNLIPVRGPLELRLAHYEYKLGQNVSSQLSWANPTIAYRFFLAKVEVLRKHLMDYDGHIKTLENATEGYHTITGEKLTNMQQDLDRFEPREAA